MHVEQKILINRDDDLANIVAKIASSLANEIFLIVPEKAKIFGRLSEMQILKEEAENLDKKLAIITSDPRGQSICLEIDIPVMDLDRIEVTKKKETITEPKRVFDITPGAQFQGEAVVPPLAVPEAPSLSRIPLYTGEEEPVSDALPGVFGEEAAVTEERPDEQSEVKHEERIEYETDRYRYESYEAERGYPAEPEEAVAEKERKEAMELKAERDDGDFKPLEGGELAEKERQIEDFYKKMAPVEKSARFSTKTKILFSFVGAAVVILTAALVLILPKAEITLETKKDKLTFDFSIGVVADSSAELDVGKAIIPGQRFNNISIPETRNDFKTTGRKNLQEKATGKISVFNAYSSASQGLVKNTRFVSKDGKIFRLVRTIVVPGAMIQEGKIIPRSIEADVIADQVGEDYNIGPSDFTIPGFQGSPKYKGFYGKSEAAMTGGARGDVAVATRDDIEKAKAVVFKDWENAANQALNQSMPPGFVLVDGAKEIKVTEQTVSVQPDKRADTFSVTMKVTIDAVAFKQSDIAAYLGKALAEKIPAEKELIPADEKISYQKGEPNFSQKPARMSLVVRVEEVSREKIDADKLKRTLAGKSNEEFEALLSNMPGLDKSWVKLWPFWVRSIPGNVDKITLIIN